MGTGLALLSERRAQARSLSLCRCSLVRSARYALGQLCGLRPRSSSGKGRRTMTDDTYDPDELDRLELVSKCDELGMSDWVRNELSSDVPRALALIAYAEGQRSLREPRAFIIARFRAGFDPRSISTPLTPNEPDNAPDDVDEPPLPWVLAHANWVADRKGAPMTGLAAMMRHVSIRHGLEAFPPHVREACELCAVAELEAAFHAHMEGTLGDQWQAMFEGVAALEAFELGLDRSFPWRVKV